jgi:Subtilase family
MPYEHLPFSRETTLADRHRRQDKRPRYRPDDPRGFGRRLGASLTEASRAAAEQDVGGYDDRLLLKVTLREGEQLPDLNAIPGIELVSQEDKTIVLAFADQQGLAEVEQRLATLARDGRTTRAQLLYALEEFDHWTPEDRTGVALGQIGVPDTETFVLDVELWPQERADRRGTMIDTFRQVLQQQGVDVLDVLAQPSLVMLRVRCDRDIMRQLLLRHRDVRTVDLPPRTGVSIEMLVTDINRFPDPEPPGDDAPAIAVLDSGVTSGHPLLAPAVGDAQGYLNPHRNAEDREPWHGTAVAGLALYGDVAEQLRSGVFTPGLRLFSGKVFEDDGNDQTEFVENAVDEAVRELNEQYGCRVFNLSYGDLNKVYDGRHLRGLAYTLDRLARELDVLFVVPTGNLRLEDLPADPRDEYPHYLFAENVRLLDPATALNVLTVGGLSNVTATRDAQRYPDTIEDLPLAAEKQPFPLTRVGPSINGAIKPDLVEHAGNLALMRTGGRTRHAGLGVVSLNGGFADGHPFMENIGTSYAAPQVAHTAVRILSVMPDASPHLLRALVGVHASWPNACEQLLGADTAAGRTSLLRVCGYGCTDESALFQSQDQTVTLYAQDGIANDKCHFYELPIPETFWSRGRRARNISVALAYSPDVRTTRLEYRMTRVWFTLVTAHSLDEVEQAFQRDSEEGMPERGTKRWISNNDRRSGTLQVSRWSFGTKPRNEDRIFVVVTRQDAPWSLVQGQIEPYALTIVLDDRENNEANLYAQVQAQLQARAQARVRARV